ncbi:hypothetical protein ACWGKU_23390 [Kitasatospora sp. NPDC054768]
MAVREDTARDVHHEPARQGRHGRPRPFGGLFRLPTLRLSGAAMAMSTVVGISIATTLLLNEQQGIGRRAGVARVGSTPPPTPGATDQAEAASEQTPTDGLSSAPAAGHPSTAPSSHLPARPSGPAPVAATPPASRTAGPGTPQTGGQASAGQDAPAHGTQLAGTGADAPAGPSPSPSVPAPPWNAQQPGYDPSAPGQGPNIPGLRPTVPGRPAPPPAASLPDVGAAGAPGKDAPTAPTGPTAPVDPVAPVEGAGPADPGSAPETDHALSGAALLSPLGRDGLRHRLTLAVAEPVTAFQAEFRLAPGESAPGAGAAWTDLPGAVVTAQQERGTLVYRFTTPPGTDVRPGHYTFGVRGARPAAEPSAAARKAAPAESWSVSAFALDHPRAVAALGGFGPAQPLPVDPCAPRARAASPLPEPADGPALATTPAPALSPATDPATAAR